MAASLDRGIQSLDQSTLLGPDVFHLEKGRWVQVQMPTIQQRRSAHISQIALLTHDEFWGVGIAIWWDGSTPTVTPLIVHYKSGVWDVIDA